MINEHIELVKKWLDNPESVSKEELKASVVVEFDREAYESEHAAYSAFAVYSASNSAYEAVAYSAFASDYPDHEDSISFAKRSGNYTFHAKFYVKYYEMMENAK